MTDNHRKIFSVIVLNKKISDLTLFGTGALGYGLIEILWRGRTHWSMVLAGGISFWGLSKISSKYKKFNLFIKSVMGCGFITALELVFGFVFNILLKRKIWDYSKMPFNIGGQICPLYSFFWFALSFIFIPVTDKIKQK